MIFAGFNIETEEVVAFGALLSALAAAIAYLFKALLALEKEKSSQTIKALDERVSVLSSRVTSFEQISMEALRILDDVASKTLGEDRKPLLQIVAPVVPEHSSPPTREEIDTARLATARARLTAASLALDIPPRT
jgi:hypothetical protein